PSRWRRNVSTAMSASLTGDSDTPLVHCRSGCLNVLSAISPASRTASANCAAVAAARALRSTSCNGQTLHPNGRPIGAGAELEIVRRLEAREHRDEAAGDRDLAHRVAAAALLDPEPGGAAAVVAGDRIDAHADQLGYVEAFVDVGDQLIGRARAGFEMK